jgi:hypothetical protein
MFGLLHTPVSAGQVPHREVLLLLLLLLLLLSELVQKCGIARHMHSCTDAVKH